MKEIAIFEQEEYMKLMDTLGLNDSEFMEEDKSIYFDAWNFGQERGEFEYSLSTESI